MSKNQPKKLEMDPLVDADLSKI